MWSLLPSDAAAAPTPVALEAAWAADADAIARLGPIPARLRAGDFETLATGGPIVHRVDAPEGSYATGAIWVDAPIALTWVAIQDAKDRPIGRDIVTEWLPGETPGRRHAYMRMALPWPVADRQWVVELVNHGPLFEATDGRVWQRRWSLADPALATAPVPDAIWTPVNEGAWTLLTVDGGTLCVLAIRTDIGGSVPTAISQTFATSSLRSGLRNLAGLAPATPEHYRDGHPVIVGPDGAPIPVAPGAPADGG